MAIIHLDEITLKQREQEIFLSNENYLEESYLVEKILVKKNHPFFAILTDLCFASKNLYNATLYQYRQNYFAYKKLIQPIEDKYTSLIKELSKALKALQDNTTDKKSETLKALKDEIEQLKLKKKQEIKDKLAQEQFKFVDCYSINQKFVSEKQIDYYCPLLNAHTSQQILRIVQQNMNSFLSLLKKKNSNDFDKPVKLPHYLDKEGLFVVPFSFQRLVKTTFVKEGLIHLSNTEIKIKHTKFDNLEKFNCIKQVRLVPKSKTKTKNTEFTIEIVRTLFPHEKQKIKEKQFLFNSNQAIIQQIQTFPKLDNNNCPVFKEKVVCKRGRKKENEILNNKAFKKIIEQVFEHKRVYQINLDEANLAGLDVNLNQLAIAYFDKQNKKDESFLINLKPLKSINWCYNYKKAKLQKILDKLKNQLKDIPYNFKFSNLTEETQHEIIKLLKINIEKITNKIKKLTTRRNKQIQVALHKISKKLIDKLNTFSINTLIIGKNKEWKKEINLGNINNQNFVMLPFAQLLEKILYKANNSGIHVIFTEESYTSKTSFFDKEELLAYKAVKNFKDVKAVKEVKVLENKDFKDLNSFLGKRISRGLFKSPNCKKLFHADINGAFNIIRKVTADLIYNYVDLTALGGSAAMTKCNFTLFH